MRLEQAGALRIGDELEHDPQAPSVCGLAQGPEIVAQAIPIGVVADRQEVARTEVGAEVEGRKKRGNIRAWRQPNGFDIKNADASIAHPAFDLPLQGQITQYGDDRVRRQRWYNAQSDGIEPCTRRQFDKRNRIRVEDGQMGKGYEGWPHDLVARASGRVGCGWVATAHRCGATRWGFRNAAHLSTFLGHRVRSSGDPVRQLAGVSAASASRPLAARGEAFRCNARTR